MEHQLNSGAQMGPGKFRTRVPGKWVLTGEHSVLMGATAVALPHPDVGLVLTFDPESLGSSENAVSNDSKGSTIRVEPPEAEEIMGSLLSTAQIALKAEGLAIPQLSGKLRIESTIPIGAGLGSSAALCVALTELMANPLSLSREKKVIFATQLEHYFHGRSSGMDVAVISAGEPISFTMNEGTQPIGVKKLPRFTFHDTHMRSRTSECVFRIGRFREEMLEIATLIDQKMGEASHLAIEGLILYDEGNHHKGLMQLKKAMQQARECFYSWELVPGEAKRLEESLLKQGALAVKLTGAGGGGMVVALWE